MLTRFRLLPLLALLPLCASAQVNIQLLHDLAETPLSTIEMYKGDAWGDTFFFIDHYYTISRQDGHTRMGMSSYFELERGLNFWHGTRLNDLYLHLEFDFSSAGVGGYGSGMASIGAKYALHNANFSRTASLALMYDHYVGPGSADVPLKFTGTWRIEAPFGLKGVTFNGFLDVWGNNTDYLTDQMTTATSHVSVMSQPQLWLNMSSIRVPNLHLGGEVVLAYNHAGVHGFVCTPHLGLKWVF